jgi:hypothetical protein
MITAPPLAAAPIAIGPALGWLGKAAVATTIDAFLDAAIAALLGSPPPGRLDHLINFGSNLIPGAGEAKKLKKIAKLAEAIDKGIDVARALEKVPGGPALVKELTHHTGKIMEAVKAGDLKGAKGALNTAIGKLREAQVATRLRGEGAEIVQLGLKPKDAAGRVLTDVDVITKQAGGLTYNQVKAGNALDMGSGSKSWGEFTTQAERTMSAAKQAGASVAYHVDKISDEAKGFLEALAKKEGVPFNLRIN